MEFIFYALIDLAAIIVVSMRLHTRWRYPEAITGDVFFHFICAQAIRNNGMRIPKSIPGFIWDTHYTYPPLYHWLLACFRTKWRARLERITSVAFDLLQSVVVFLFSYYLFSNTGPSEQAIGKSIAVAAATLLSPVYNAQIWGPRVVTGTPRPMGEAVFVLGMIALLMWESGHGIGYALASALLFGLLPLVSKFGFQVLIFFLMFLFLLFKWQWILIIAAGVLSVWVLSFGLTGQVIRGHYEHSRFYFLFLQHHYYGLRNRQSGFFGIREYWDRFFCQLKNLRGLFVWFISERNFYHIMFYYNLHLWISLVMLSFWDTAIVDRLPAGRLLVLLSLAPIMPAFLTSLPGLRFMGENYRYFEYYQWLFWVLLMAASPVAFVIVAVLYAAFSLKLVQDAFAQVGSWHREYVASEAFFSWIRNELAGERLNPLGGRYYECLYRTGLPILLWPANMRLDTVPREDLEELFDAYPFPKAGTGYQRVMKKYGVRYVLCHEQTVAFLPSSNFEYLERVATPPCHLQLYRVSSL